MEIIRNFEQELVDAEKCRQERMVVRAIASGIITQDGGAELLRELWK